MTHPGKLSRRASLFITLLLGWRELPYQLIALRSYAPLADAGKLKLGESFLGSPGFGERTYWLRVGSQLGH